VLESERLVVIPTDTVYGLAAKLDRKSAVDRIFRVKQRPRSKPLPVLVRDLDAAMELAVFPIQALVMAKEGWPGPLTLVLKAAPPLPSIGGDGGSVGLRIPNHPFALELLARCGPLAVTSANPSGALTGVSIDDIVGDLGDGVHLYVNGGVLEAPPSQVVSLIGETRILRPRD
jgi:L-threonylcarbamoyladenylate synthase